MACLVLDLPTYLEPLFAYLWGFVVARDANQPIFSFLLPYQEGGKPLRAVLSIESGGTALFQKTVVRHWRTQLSFTRFDFKGLVCKSIG